MGPTLLGLSHELLLTTSGADTTHRCQVAIGILKTKENCLASIAANNTHECLARAEALETPQVGRESSMNSSQAWYSRLPQRRTATSGGVEIFSLFPTNLRRVPLPQSNEVYV